MTSENRLHQPRLGGLRPLADGRPSAPPTDHRLVGDALRDPHAGIGKPEPLKYALAGAWSRRITDEHRLVHLVANDEIVILQARYRYE
ncbi:Txe/YoeB family addiction module toxin [Nonomuraea muscovyensis]|uniref:Txe/YoeB family addiction module toxin n=1 Tax=Nonomuraea muscovyensis TaxID=1124761 RepID=UPI0033FB7D6A